MLKNDVLKKKVLVLHKAFIMQNGERMKVKVDGDVYYLSETAAVAALLNDMSQAQKDTKEFEKLKGTQVSILKISIPMQKIISSPNADTLLQDGDSVYASINLFQNMMKISETRLVAFDYEPNKADGGTTLDFTNIVLEKK